MVKKKILLIVLVVAIFVFYPGLAGEVISNSTNAGIMPQPGIVNWTSTYTHYLGYNDAPNESIIGNANSPVINVDNDVSGVNAPENLPTGANVTPVPVVVVARISGKDDSGNNSSGFSGTISSDIQETKSADNKSILSNNVTEQFKLVGTETILSLGKPWISKKNPTIYGDLIAWEEPKSESDVILIYNLSSGREFLIPQNNPGGNRKNPSIWKDKIAFTEMMDDFSTIYVFNSTSGSLKQIVPDSTIKYPENPKIFGDYIVFSDIENEQSDVYLYDLVNNVTVSLEKAGPDSKQYAPAISGDKICYLETVNSNISLMLYNITTQTRMTAIDNTNDFYLTPPSIMDDKIAWEDWRNNNFDIYVYNLTDESQTLVTTGTDTTDQLNPSIFGDLLVYEDRQSGYSQVHLVNLSDRSDQPLVQGHEESNQQIPKIFENRIVWQDDRNGISDIYLFSIGTLQPEVESDFSVNTTVGLAPFTVEFVDQSSGNITSRHWDFGDGNESYEMNPIHTYTDAGQFTVSLTVSTPFRRDNKRIDDLIVSGSPPDAGFIGSPLSGPAPLTVTFSDLSSGYPITWQWDFGDNSTSSEENPVHVFTSPGNYSVRLLAANEFGNDSASEDINVVNSLQKQVCLNIPSIIEYSEDDHHFVINKSYNDDYIFGIENNGSLLYIDPPPGSGITKIVLFSQNSSGINTTNDLISGNMAGIQIISDYVSPPGSGGTLGNYSAAFYSVTMPEYYPEGTIENSVSREITADEFLKFQQTISNSNFPADTIMDPVDVAYILYCKKNNIADVGQATITMTVSHQWVIKDRFSVARLDAQGQPQNDQYGRLITMNSSFISEDSGNHFYYYEINEPDGIDLSNIVIPVYNRSLTLDGARVQLVSPSVSTGTSPVSVIISVDSDWVEWNYPNQYHWTNGYEPIVIIRIDDSGNGEVLHTTFNSHNETGNLDVFCGDSPHGLSEFALAKTSMSGNPLQMLYLSLSSRVTPPPPGNSNTVSGGGSSGGGGGSYGGSGNLVTSAPEPSASTDNLAETSKEGSPITTLSNDGQSAAVSGESVLTEGQPASSLQRESHIPAANPPALPPQPTNSIFSMVFEVAALVSVILIVVFSVSLRYRQREREKE